MTLRDFLHWFEGISENIEAAPSEKQWARIKEKLLALKAAPEAGDAAPEARPQARPAPPPKPPKPKFPFYIDEQNFARKGNGTRILPAEVTAELHDLRGIDGDMKTIIWADDSVGLNGRELTIVAA